MRNRAFTVLLLATYIASGSCQSSHRETRVANGPEQHFSLWLEHSPSGWTAHCDSGCSWNDVTMKCGNCEVRVDADGIAEGPVATPPRGFAFVVDDHNGLSAHGVQGVRWLDLSWNCVTAVCRARISEEGVHVPT
jgi:hypothetical protein